MYDSLLTNTDEHIENIVTIEFNHLLEKCGNLKDIYISLATNYDEEEEKEEDDVKLSQVATELSCENVSHALAELRKLLEHEAHGLINWRNTDFACKIINESTKNIIFQRTINVFYKFISQLIQIVNNPKHGYGSSISELSNTINVNIILNLYK